MLSKKIIFFQAISKNKSKKRSSQKFFRRSPHKNVFQKLYQALHKILTNQKIVLSSSRGQGQGLDLRGQGQGQGLQKVFSRTSWRPKTSSRTPHLETRNAVVKRATSIICSINMFLQTKCWYEKKSNNSPKSNLRFTSQESIIK